MFTLRCFLSAGLLFLTISRFSGEISGQVEDVLRSRSAQEDIVAGQVISINENRLNIREGEEARTYLLSPETVVTIAGRQVRVGDLPPNARVRILLSGEGTPTVKTIVVIPEEEQSVILPTETADTQEAGSTPGTSLPRSRQEAIDEQPQPAFVTTDPVSRVPLGMSLETTAEGIRVNEVAENSPAANAGLKPGDLIFSVGGRNIATTQGFYRELQKRTGGEAIAVTYRRNQEPMSATLTLPQSHQAQRDSTSVPQTAPARTSDILTTPQIGWVLQQRGDIVEIASVEAGTPAALSGFQVGDEIVTVAGEPVRSADHVLQMLQTQGAGTSVGIEIRREGQVMLRGMLLPTSRTVVAANKPPVTSTGNVNEEIASLQQQLDQQSQLLIQLADEVQALREELEQLRNRR